SRRLRLDTAAGIDWRPPYLWRLAHGADGTVAAWRPRGGCARPSSQQPDSLHESGEPLDLLEHELPRRAPHVSHGALSRVAEIARADQERSSRPQPLDRQRLCGDDPCAMAATEGTRLFLPPRA